MYQLLLRAPSSAAAAAANAPQYFAHHGVEAQLLPLPTCEENKHFGLVEQIAEAIEGFKINRWGEG